MSEYQVRFRVSVPGFFFAKTTEGVEIYEADSAQEALEKAKAETVKARMMDVDDETSVEILDVRKNERFGLSGPID